MVTALLLFALLLAPVPQEKEKEKEENKPPKRGDVVVAKGCLRGGMLENADLGRPGGGGSVPELLTYRLTGDKKILEEIRKEHDGHSDEITGELRTDLPNSMTTYGKKVGNTRIVIGAGSNRGMNPEPPPPPMPVLKVTSFEHTGISCR
jgi:hypothetical protein